MTDKKNGASQFHKNKSHHNWLAYKLLDRFFEDNQDAFKGVFYDLGCGQAPYKDYLAPMIDTYVGVDWEGSPHDIHADIKSNLSDKLPIKDNVADCVMAISVLEHIDEPQIMVNETFRILKKNGNFVFQVPWQWWIHEAPYDFFRYSPYALEKMLTKAGFESIKIKPMGGFFTMWFLKLNYFLKRSNRGPKILRYLLKAIFIPLYYVFQWLAPLMDKLDSDWMLETCAYSVRATKP